MININPDCREYIAKIHEIYKSQNRCINALFDTIKEKSLLAAVELLSLVDLDVFKAKIHSTFISIIDRGSPASFQLFKGIINDEDRRKVLWETVYQLDRSDLALIIFKAKYYSHINEHQNALDLIILALENNPKSSDLIMLKAHVQKKMNLAKDANETISIVQNLSMSDKFSISKTAKYMIRYGSISNAQEIIGKFIQKPNRKEKMNDLHEMQAIWYLIEMADRLFKDGNIIHSACFYRKIELIFDELLDDQLDFHGFSLRKMSFIEYIKY